MQQPKDRLSAKRAVKAAGKIQRLLYEGDDKAQSAIQTIWDIINCDEEVTVGVHGEIEVTRAKVSAKEKIAAVNLLSRLVLHREQVAAATGLSKRPDVKTEKKIVNLTVNNMSLTAEARKELEGFLLDQLDPEPDRLLPIAKKVEPESVEDSDEESEC